MKSLPISKGLFTYFMEREGVEPSAAVLAYGLLECNHGDMVTSFVIDEEARYSVGTDHAMLIADI